MHVEISDDGEGVPADMENAIFESYVQVLLANSESFESCLFLLYFLCVLMSPE